MNRHVWGAVVLLSWAALTTLSGAEEPRARVLLVGKQPDHPFGTHMYLHTLGMLSQCLAKSGVATTVSDGWPRDAAQLEDVDAIVVYATPAAEFLLDGPHRGQVQEMMKQGVGLVTIHWASSVHKANLERLGPTWMSYLGGTWVSNVGLHTGKSPLEQLAPEHPICNGWKSYELLDEYYLNPTLGPQATPLLRVRAKQQPVVVGWAFERPEGGRSYATTLGHFYANFQRPPFRKMIVNAILWTAEVEVPAAGAPVDLTAEQLALPPQQQGRPAISR